MDLNQQPSLFESVAFEEALLFFDLYGDDLELSKVEFNEHLSKCLGELIEPMLRNNF